MSNPSFLYCDDVVRNAAHHLKFAHDSHFHVISVLLASLLSIVLSLLIGSLKITGLSCFYCLPYYHLQSKCSRSKFSLSLYELSLNWLHFD